MRFGNANQIRKNLGRRIGRQASGKNHQFAMGRMGFDLPPQFLQVFGGNSESGFVQLGLCSLLGIVDLQVDARFPRDLNKIRRNSLRAESVQDKAAIAACHQPQRADRRAQTLKGLSPR